MMVQLFDDKLLIRSLFPAARKQLKQIFATTAFSVDVMNDVEGFPPHVIKQLNKSPDWPQPFRTTISCMRPRDGCMIIITMMNSSCQGFNSAILTWSIVVSETPSCFITSASHVLILFTLYKVYGWVSVVNIVKKSQLPGQRVGFNFLNMDSPVFGSFFRVRGPVPHIDINSSLYGITHTQWFLVSADHTLIKTVMNIIFHFYK